MTTKTQPSSLAARSIVLIAAVLVTLIGATPARAHDSAEGSIAVSVDEQRAVVTAPVSFTSLGFADPSGDGRLDTEEFAAQEAAVGATLVATVRDKVGLSIDGTAVDIIGAGVPSLHEPTTGDVTLVGSQHVMLVLVTDTYDGALAEVSLRWAFDSPSTTVVLSYADGAITGELSDDGTISFQLNAVSSAASFFKLGTEHIQYGPDHLLFLLVLTLAVVGTTVTRSTTWQTVKLVTAFTVGHAISLGLAYFDVVSIPAAIVEPAISLSIVFAAVVALRGGASDTRPWLVVLVGLVHGLGFASSLSSLGVATSQRVAALAAFNLGIDVAQTAVVLGVVAALWVSGKVLANRVVWLRAAAAAGAAMFGVLWTATRVSELIA